MRAKTILLLLFITSFAIAGLIVLHAMPGAKATAEVPHDEVLVATAPLAAGTLLRAEDVAWRPITSTAEAEEFARPTTVALKLKPELDEEARAAVYGAALRVAVGPYEPLLRHDIVTPGAREFLNVVLSPGARALSIPLATGGAGTGLLHPGDRVDVVLTQNFKSQDTPLTRRSVSETVVENLRVLAIDPVDVKPVTTGNGFGRTVTLEVIPVQAEKINVAIELGKLSIDLRGTNGTSDALADSGTGTPVKPTWAVDVSPALNAASTTTPAAAIDGPPLRVMRGNKTEDLKTQ